MFEHASRAGRSGLLLALMCVFPVAARGGEPAPRREARVSDSGLHERWAGWSFVMGEWTGVGTGAPGEAEGGFSFTQELDGHVLMRRSHADIPPAGGRPGYRHEDLMVIHREPGEADAHALYLDNEGHVIHYVARVAAGGDTLILLSRPAPGTPGFRFTYVKADERILALRFEIASPARPDSFSTYLAGTARRKGGR